MRTLILIAAFLCLLTETYGKRKISDTATSNIPAHGLFMKGCKFMLEYQAFETRDEDGTHTDTVRHKGDYILLAANGTAYIHFDGKHDSIRYTFPDKNSISFGDTPFMITHLGNGLYKLVQNEEDSKGEYNRTTYLLKKKPLLP